MYLPHLIDKCSALLNAESYRLLNPMILAYKSSAAAGQAGAPVFGGVDLLELVGLAYVGEAFVDELPAAGAVEHVFGAAGDGADAAKVGP